MPYNVCASEPIAVGKNNDRGNVSNTIHSTLGSLADTSAVLDMIIKNLTGYEDDCSGCIPDPGSLFEAAEQAKITSEINLNKVNQIMEILFK